MWYVAFRKQSIYLLSYATWDIEKSYTYYKISAFDHDFASMIMSDP